MNIVILNNVKKDKPSDKNLALTSIIAEGKKRGHDVRVLSPNYLCSFISSSERGYDRIYDGHPTHDSLERIYANKIDAIIPRLGNISDYNCNILNHLNNNLGIYSTQNAFGIRNAADKYQSLRMLSQKGIRTPATMYIPHDISDDKKDNVIEKFGGFPIILKTAYGSQGKGVHKVNTMTVLKQFITKYKNLQKDILLQSFIESQPVSDIRAIVVDGVVVTAMRRIAPEGEFRANLAKGATGEKMNLSPALKSFCVNMAFAVGLRTAGVDFILDVNNVPYAIEVNGNFGFKVQTITKRNIAKDLILQCENNVKK